MSDRLIATQEMQGRNRREGTELLSEMQSVLSKNDSGHPSDNLRSEGMFSTASGNRERMHPLI